MASAIISTHNETIVPKFNEYRSRVMLGDLPSDFLRIQLEETQIYNQSFPRQGNHANPNFLGHLTLTIAEAKLIKNSGPLGFLRMDPYVRFQIGHVSQETPAASGGGKTPQWKISYRINLFKGMDQIHIEVFDQRSFTEDSFIGECDIEIPGVIVSEGQTQQHWYPLMGRDANKNENQGDILIIMSFTPIIGDNLIATETSSFSGSPPLSSSSSRSNSITESAAVYSPDDIRTIEEMFPGISREIIIELLEKYGGNKDIVVNQLLQSHVS